METVSPILSSAQPSPVALQRRPANPWNHPVGKESNTKIQESQTPAPIPKVTSDGSYSLIDLEEPEPATPSPFNSPLYPQSALSSISPSSAYTNLDFVRSPNSAVTPLTPPDFGIPFSPAASSRSPAPPYFSSEPKEYIPTPVSPAPRYRPPTRVSGRAEKLRQNSLPTLSLPIETSFLGQEFRALPFETKNVPFSPSTAFRDQPVRSSTTPPTSEQPGGRGEPVRSWVADEFIPPASPRKWKNLFKWRKPSPKSPFSETRNRNHWLNNVHEEPNEEMAGSPSIETRITPLGGRIQAD